MKKIVSVSLFLVLSSSFFYTATLSAKTIKVQVQKEIVCGEIDPYVIGDACLYEATYFTGHKRERVLLIDHEETYGKKKTDIIGKLLSIKVVTLTKEEQNFLSEDFFSQGPYKKAKKFKVIQDSLNVNPCLFGKTYSDLISEDNDSFKNLFTKSIVTAKDATKKEAFFIFKSLKGTLNSFNDISNVSDEDRLELTKIEYLPTHEKFYVITYFFDNYSGVIVDEKSGQTVAQFGDDDIYACKR